MQIQPFLSRTLGIRILLTFIGGLMLGLFASKVGGGIQNLLPYLLFPLLIGILGAFTVRSNTVRPYLTSTLTGLVTWLGVGLYLLIFASSHASQACTTGDCSAITILPALFTLYVLIGFGLVVIGALMACSSIRYYRSRRTDD